MRYSRLLSLPLLVALLVGGTPVVTSASATASSDNPCRGVTSDVAQLQPPQDAAYRRLVAQTATPITDGHGYTITAHDAWFFGLNGTQLANWRARTAPLTLTPGQFNTFTHELFEAAAADGLDGRLDIRLKGSSAGFWSNPMKAMPADAEQAADLYFSKKKAWPDKAWCARVAKRFAEWLGPDRVGDEDAVPTYRPFNALHTLGILDDKSDVDVQISSDQAAAKITAVCTATGTSPCKSDTYGFFRKTPAAQALPAITAMLGRWEDVFKLDFTYAVFPGSGPDNYLSSFRATDWIIAPPCTHTTLTDTAPDTPLDWQNPGLQTCPLVDPMPSSALILPAGQPVPAPGDSAWASSQTGGGLTGTALLDAVLAPATLARIAQLDTALAANKSTAKLYRDEQGQWTAERTELHRKLIDQVWNAAAQVPTARRAVYAGGLPGAGKTTFLASPAAKANGINIDDYLTINPDDMKALLVATPGAVPDYPGLTPNETASLIHEESSYLADELLTRALAAGKNVLIDRTMGAAKPVKATLKDLHELGYHVTSVYIDSTPAESLARAEFRYRGKAGDYSGRPIAFASVANTPVDAQGRTPSRVTFETVAAPGSDAWLLVAHHKLGEPVLIAEGRKG